MMLLVRLSLLILCLSREEGPVCRVRWAGWALLGTWGRHGAPWYGGASRTGVKPGFVSLLLSTPPHGASGAS